MALYTGLVVIEIRAPLPLPYLELARFHDAGKKGGVITKGKEGLGGERGEGEVGGHEGGTGRERVVHALND